MLRNHFKGFSLEDYCREIAEKVHQSQNFLLREFITYDTLTKEVLL